MKITRLLFRLEELSKPLQINYVVGNHCLEKSNNNDLLFCQEPSVYLVACGLWLVAITIICCSANKKLSVSLVIQRGQESSNLHFMVLCVMQGD